MGEDGALFVWGYGFCGQLEMGDTQLPVLPSLKGETPPPSVTTAVRKARENPHATISTASPSNTAR